MVSEYVCVCVFSQCTCMRRLRQTSGALASRISLQVSFAEKTARTAVEPTGSIPNALAVQAFIQASAPRGHGKHASPIEPAQRACILF